MCDNCEHSEHCDEICNDETLINETPAENVSEEASAEDESTDEDSIA